MSSKLRPVITNTGLKQVSIYSNLDSMKVSFKFEIVVIGRRYCCHEATGFISPNKGCFSMDFNNLPSPVKNSGSKILFDETKWLKM
ncbi:hypothetical protein MAR_021758 [Mya arenaria]|uniref:Uncharacterized protein n=1 Tax=Mya arenaria TaxID=6604 RepID=A0ABY7EB37_MYAAR|nr:hypothetical protein MAR_021758 [Mya arenaria]